MTMLVPAIVARPRLGTRTREEMFALHSRHFANVSRGKFLADLDEKEWIILLRDADGRTAGFSTQQLLAEIPGTGGARFLFSGDTIVAPEHWNTPYLAGCFGHLMLRLIREHPRTPLYWFLISKGFRTYRFLPVFFARFWPDPRSPAPPGGAELLRTVAAWKFGACYDAADGLVKDAAGDRLAAPLAAVPEAKRRDPHTRFFLERNPQYALGHELACLAPITTANFTAPARRVIAHTAPEWME